MTTKRSERLTLTDQRVLVEALVSMCVETAGLPCYRTEHGMMQEMPPSIGSKALRAMAIVRRIRQRKESA